MANRFNGRLITVALSGLRTFLTSSARHVASSIFRQQYDLRAVPLLVDDEYTHASGVTNLLRSRNI